MKRKTGNFFTIQNVLVDCFIPLIGLDGLALYQIYTRLQHHEKGYAFPSIARLVKTTGLSSTTIINANDRLEDYGLITIDRQFLFKLGRDYAVELDKRIVSNELRQEFAQNEFSLSHRVNVSSGRRYWLVTDKVKKNYHQRYYITECNESLAVLRPYRGVNNRYYVHPPVVTQDTLDELRDMDREPLVSGILATNIVATESILPINMVSILLGNTPTTKAYYPVISNNTKEKKTNKTTQSFVVVDSNKEEEVSETQLNSLIDAFCERTVVSDRSKVRTFIEKQLEMFPASTLQEKISMIPAEGVDNAFGWLVSACRDDYRVTVIEETPRRLTEAEKKEQEIAKKIQDYRSNLSEDQRRELREEAVLEAKSIPAFAEAEPVQDGHIRNALLDTLLLSVENSIIRKRLGIDDDET